MGDVSPENYVLPYYAFCCYCIKKNAPIFLESTVVTKYYLFYYETAPYPHSVFMCLTVSHNKQRSFP